MISSFAAALVAICSINYAVADFGDDCLNLHNSYRALHVDTPMLSYDEALAQQAKAHAESMLDTNPLDIQDGATLNTKSYGENVYMNRSMDLNTLVGEFCLQAIERWYGQNDPYQYEPIPNYMSKGFTQVVWKNTLRVGCGQAKTEVPRSNGYHRVLIVCRYQEPGNREDQYRDNVMPLKIGISKKGVVVTPANYKCEDLMWFAGINMWHNFGLDMPDAIDGPCDHTPFQEHVSVLPKKFGTQHVGETLPEGTRYLMAFKGPNHVAQANMTPTEAAVRWKQMEASLDAAGRNDVILLSPSASHCTEGCLEEDPFVWFEQFFGNCSDCNTSRLATHLYSCDTTWTMNYINELFDRFDRKIWLVAYSCNLAQNFTQMATYMRDTIELFQASDKVERYFWYASRIPDSSWLTNITQLLVDDYYTDLGEFYNYYHPGPDGRFWSRIFGLPQELPL